MSTSIFRSCIISFLIKTKQSGIISKQLGSAYDHDGKTRINILNTKSNENIFISSYSQYGFRLNNNFVALGPVAVFPRTILSWNVNSFEDVNEDSLSLFTVLDPKLDVLIVGIGDQLPNRCFSQKIIHFMSKYKINVEVLRTEQACATFNFLNHENRVVAAALIPPIHITYNENNLLGTSGNLLQKLSYEKSFANLDKQL